MDREEAARRDEEVRQSIVRRTWDSSPEFGLIQRLVRDRHPLLEGFPFLVDHEWEVARGRSQDGRGDLLFTNGEGGYAVVEAKWLDFESTGKTAKRRRTKHRGKVFEQAFHYAEQCWMTFDDAQTVDAMTLTNEEGLQVVGRCTCGDCKPLG